MTSPYLRHLSAADPQGFAHGFSRAAIYAQRHPHMARLIHRVIASSTGQPWRTTATMLAMPPTAESEGLALGVYGLVALERLEAQP